MAKSLTKKTVTKAANKVKSVEAENVTVENIEDTTDVVDNTAAIVTETIKQLTKSNKQDGDYEAEDLIPCRSVFEGTLFLGGDKSEILYRWSGYGDVQDVEYQDLRALLAKRSSYLLQPLFIIEDEDLLAQPKWDKLNELYSEMFASEDLDDLFNLSADSFKKAIANLPEKFKNTVLTGAGERIASGKLDSLTKIKAIDELFGTDLVSTLVK